MKCKYCNSEMDLMESVVNYFHYICMNDNCRATLTTDEGYDDYWEEPIDDDIGLDTVAVAEISYNYGFTTTHDGDNHLVLFGTSCNMCGKYFEDEDIDVYCNDCRK